MSERLRTADQFVPTLAYGDAIGNDAFELQRLFWQRGVQSDIFVDEAKPEVLAFARSRRDLRPKRLDAGGLLLVHMSMGNDTIDVRSSASVRMTAGSGSTSNADQSTMMGTTAVCL